MVILLSLLCTLQEGLSDKDPDRRARAIAEVRAKGDLAAARAILPLMGDDHPRVRYRATAALSEFSDPAVTELLVSTGLRHPKPLVRRGACEALGAHAPVGALAERLRDSDPDVRAAAAQALGKSKNPDALEALFEAFRREADRPNRAFVLEAVARLDSARAREILPVAARDNAYQTRLVAAELWADVHPEGALEGMGTLVGDRDWRVRAAAIEACRGFRHRAAVGWLVGQLGEERGRLRWDILTALRDLADRDLGLDPRPWRTWWEANRETFEVKPRPAARSAPAPGGITTKASFFNIPILSKAIIFILDLSGSMREPAPEPGRTKLEVAQRGMIETLRVLEPDARFGILGLGSDIDGRYAHLEQKTWRRRLELLPAVPAVKADAERFVRGLEAKGWTNLYDAIEHAFGRPEVDTIFLYSDGGASKGVFVAAREILDHLTRMNRFRRIVIHTVEVPGERNPADNRRLLAEIAARTGGGSRLHDAKNFANPPAGK